VGRGWTEFKLSLRSPQDQGFYVFMALIILGYLWFNRSNEIEFGDASLPFPTVTLPSILGAMIAFGMVLGPGYALAMQREDGTLLRAKAIPNGVVGFLTGQAVTDSLGIIPSFTLVLLPSAILFDGLMQQGAAGWGTFIWVTILGMLATFPIGVFIGSVVPGVQKMGTWGMLPFIAITAISGIFAPIQSLWGWLQVVGQVFPIYWIGLGMRSAFLPEAAAAFELTGSWRTAQTALVLLAWAVAGFVVAPIVVRRMARSQSGSAVQAAREQALQWVR
jgi:ABC-2 type transport system permease protein